MVIKRIGILTPRSGGRGRPPDSRRDGGATNTDLVQMWYVAGAGWHCSLPDAESGNTQTRGIATMTWIRTIPMSEADEKLRQAVEGQKGLYPKEYFEPVHPDESGGSSIVGSHTLIPDALYHSFATFGALMSPELPLSRRQHEMITTMVSVTNRCVY